MVAEQPPERPPARRLFNTKPVSEAIWIPTALAESSVQSVESEKEKEMLRNPHKTVGGSPCFGL